MKRIQSKFLAIAFAVSSVLSMQGMEPWQPAPRGAEPKMTEDNDVHLLGMPLVHPGDMSLHQKRDKDEAEAKAKKDAMAHKSVVIPAPKVIPMPIVKKNGVRSLIDLLPPKFKNISVAVWQNHLASCIDHGSSIFPAQLKPMEIKANQESNLEWAPNRLSSKVATENAYTSDMKSFDEKFVAETRLIDEGLSPVNPFSKTLISIYNSSSRELIYAVKSKERARGKIFSSKSNYFFISYYNLKKPALLIDLSRKTAIEILGSDVIFSLDGRLCAVFYIDHKFIGRSSDDQRYASNMRVTVIDLQAHKEVGVFVSEDIPVLSYPWLDAFNFSNDNTALKVDISFSLPVDHQLQHSSRSWQFDLSFFKDREMQNAVHNKLTPEQSMLLLLLDEVKNKHKDKSISLLRDIALKQMLSLRELQTTLASFHPLVTQTIIERYGIIDPTREAIEKAKQKKAAQNRWKDMVKLSSFATLLGALTCWYFK